MARSTFHSSRRYLLAAAVFAASVLGGCASVNTSPPDKVVGERAQQRWDLLLKSDYGKAYDYLSPAQRAVTTRESYIGRFSEGAKWLSVKLDKVSCETEDRCIAELELKTIVVARGFSGPIATKMSEIWIHDEGGWWFHKNQ